MDKSILVQKVNSGHGLNKKVKGFVFRKNVLLPCADNVEQIALLHVLQHQVDGRRVFQRGIETHNVLVLELLLDGDLSLEGFLNLRACERCLFNSLDRDTYATRFVHCQADCAVCPSADLLRFELKI